MNITLIPNKSKALYSRLLKQLEQTFTYPLGDNTFHIKHGNEDISYFDFFEQLGKRNTFSISKNKELIGTGCAILRNVCNNSNQRFWYLCDFKLNKSFRSKKVLWALLLKNALSFYLQANKVVTINMSPPDKNGLLKQVSKYLFFLKLNVVPLYIYEWSVDDLKRDNHIVHTAELNMGYFTNGNTKNIIINGHIQPIYHLVNKDHAIKNLPFHHEVSLSEITKSTEHSKPIIMLATTDISLFVELSSLDEKPSAIGSVLYSKKLDVNDLRISSLEI